MENNCGIYCWTNKASNNKKYIGQSKNLKKRKLDFLRFEKPYSGKLINMVRVKYNDVKYWDYEILEYCDDKELDDKEIYYINLYDTTNKKKGYNLGEGGSTNKGVKQSKETIEKRAKQFKKKVYQLNINTLEIIREWDGVIDVARHYGINSSSILACCQGRYYSSLGYKWCYIDGINNIKKGIFEREKRKILQVDKCEDKIIKIWDSAEDISKAIGVTKHQLYGCCNGSVKGARGFRWCYEENGITKDWSEKTKYSRIKQVVQIDPKTNEIINIFHSASEADKAMNLKRSTICQVCDENRTYNITAAGYKWAYVGTEINEDWIKKTTYKTPKTVLQIDPETNKIIKQWDMITDASKSLHIGIPDICACCNGKQYTAKGYIWQYKDNPIPYIRKSRKKSIYQMDKQTETIIKEWDGITDIANYYKCSHAAITNCCRGKSKSAIGFKWRYKNEND